MNTNEFGGILCSLIAIVSADYAFNAEVPAGLSLIALILMIASALGATHFLVKVSRN